MSLLCLVAIDPYIRLLNVHSLFVYMSIIKLLTYLHA